MAGSLSKLSNGSWHLRVYVGRDPLTGKKTWERRTVRGSKRDAELALAALVLKARGATTRAPVRTFGELVERWYAARSSDWSPSTAQQTRWIIDGYFAGLRDRRVDSIGVEDLDIFYGELRRRGGRNGRPLAGATVNRIHTVIRGAMAQGVSWGWLRENPAASAKAGRLDRAEIKPPLASEVRTLFDAAMEKDSELLTFIALEAETGARRGELAALRFSDIIDGSVTIARSLVIGIDTPENRARYHGHVWAAGTQRSDRHTLLIEKPKPKNRRSIRTIAVSAAAQRLLEEYRLERAALAAACGTTLPTDGFLFSTEPDGSRPIRPETWTRRFSVLRSGVGLESVRLHDLRHYVATTLLASGVDLATVAGRLGHGGGGKTTLAIYAHFVENAPPDRAAAELLSGLVRSGGASARPPAAVS